MLAGPYRLLEQLGEGGMGSVWKAEHVLLRTPVAIKIIDPAIAKDEFSRARFLREAQALASLRSPHVVSILDYGADADTAYLVMELLQGETLGRRLQLRRRLSLGEMTSILKDVCAAMSVVHECGLVHRDLKPDNIFLCSTHGRLVAKVVDFGIAKPLREPVPGIRTRTGHLLGTPSYMSPEQCRGLKDVDQRSDVWSLGVIVYQCLVGSEPFQADALGDVLLRICMDPLPVPSEQSKHPLPLSFDAWFARAVARSREERFQSAEELFVAFSCLSTIRGLGTQAPSVAPRSEAPVALATEEVAPSAPGSNSDTEASVTVGLASRRAMEPSIKWGAGALLLLLVLAVGIWRAAMPGNGEPRLGVGVESLNAAPRPSAHAPSSSSSVAPPPTPAPAPTVPPRSELVAPAPPQSPASAAPEAVPLPTRPERPLRRDNGVYDIRRSR